MHYVFQGMLLDDYTGPYQTNPSNPPVRRQKCYNPSISRKPATNSSKSHHIQSPIIPPLTHITTHYHYSFLVLRVVCIRNMSLPPPSSTQAFCDVSALEAGIIELPLVMFVTNNPEPGAVSVAPSLSFLLRHSNNGQKFVFDLGIRKDWESYPPRVVQWVKDTFEIRVPQDAVESLTNGGAPPSEITTVCLSHCHFDHVGDTRPFVNSTFIVGGGSKEHFQPGYPADPNSPFASDLLPLSRTEFLSNIEWPPLGPFPHALDFYGDGSLYIIDSPGHLAGHINVLARTSPDGAWIYLAGDSAHHWDLITGASDIAVGHPSHFHSCAHQDKEAAETHILRIRELCGIPRVRVLLAHDEPWYIKNRGGNAFLPGKIPSL